MLTRYDEWTCHQIVETFAYPGCSDRAWTEKIWLNLHDTQGRFALAIGLGVYPNRNVMDGFACLRLGSRQTNVRLSRQLRPRVDELSVGPLSYRILDPFRRLAVDLSDSRQGLRFQVEFQGRFHPVEEQPHQFWRDATGRVAVDTARYSQTGRASGWVEWNGQRTELDPNEVYAQRDHSWGIRPGVGTPEPGLQDQETNSFAGAMINWAIFQFPSWSVSLYYIEANDGKARFLSGAISQPLDEPDEQVRVVGVEHDYEFFPGSLDTKSGSLTLHLEDGSHRKLHLEALQVMHLRGGGYLGVGEYNHGKWMGPEHEEGETWNLEDPATKAMARGLDDTICRVTHGDETGYGILENLIIPPFERYGVPAYPQRRP